MKFIHISDVHLGMKPDLCFKWSDARVAEIFETFNRIIDICNRDKVDLLLVAGDLFHSQPSIKMLKEANYSFSKLENTQVVLMAGNHDYAPEGSKFYEYEWLEHVHMLSSGKVEDVYLENIDTHIYGFSYETRNITIPRYDDIAPYDTSKINILLAHGGEPNYVPIDFNKLKDSKFDYVALGHIHKPEIINERIAYAGSLEPLDKTELGDHGYIYGEVTKESCVIQHVPFAKRKYIKLVKHVEGEITNGELIDSLKEDIDRLGTENIYTIM